MGTEAVRGGRTGVKGEARTLFCNNWTHYVGKLFINMEEECVIVDETSGTGTTPPRKKMKQKIQLKQNCLTIRIRKIKKEQKMLLLRLMMFRKRPNLKKRKRCRTI